jgi:protein TonB
MLPPVEAPPAPLSMRDFVKVLPPPPAPPRPPPPAQRQAPSAPAPSASPLQHSPLASTPNQQPSASAAPSAFVNPAQEASQARAKDAYLWQVIRKFSQYLPDLRSKNEGGTVVLRFVIARDGRLMEANIVQSSGVIALDRGLLESLKAASPYPPLPAAIPGSQVVFTQPIAAKR